ncbi:MAG: hypothetical protein ACREWE_00910 [Gammaproteobacteria bacterium]
MKRTSILMTLAATLSLPLASESTPVLFAYEGSVEGGTVVALKMEVTAKKEPTGNGVVTIGRQCRGCAPLRLKVTPLSQVIVAGRPVPITSEAQLIGKTGDVFYVIEDKRLTRIQLY